MGASNLSSGIIIQARMGSCRLPGKVLRPIGTLPLLGHISARLSTLSKPLPVVVATTKLKQDDPIVDWCKHNDLDFFRGSEDDVLERYYQCSMQFGFSHVVRLTADNPFTDIVELERLVDFHLSRCSDYTHSFGDLPVGVGAEIFTFEALKNSHYYGLGAHHREHVNEYIQENPDLFRINILPVPRNKHASYIRLTVDTHEDWVRADRIARESNAPAMSTEELITKCISFA
jgi:spore coat polysaccharide biosynthesis protein SpsF